MNVVQSGEFIKSASTLVTLASLLNRIKRVLDKSWPNFVVFIDYFKTRGHISCRPAILEKYTLRANVLKMCQFFTDTGVNGSVKCGGIVYSPIEFIDAIRPTVNSRYYLR